MNIKGLTLIRPWAWAILHAGKDVENRSWKPTANQLQVGDWLAIHAGMKWEQEEVFWMEDMFGVKVPHQDEHPKGVIVGLVRYVDCVTRSSSLWFFGPYGWRWDKVIVLSRPIPHKGAQGLWTLQPEAYERCKAIIESVDAK